MAHLWMNWLNEELEFLGSRDFNQNIGNVLVQATAHTLKINLSGYQYNYEWIK